MNDWLGSVGKFLDWDWTFEHWEKWFFVLCMLMHSCMLSHFSRVWLFVILWTVALQVPLSMGFSRQEYWSGLPCLPPGHFPDPGIKPVSPAATALKSSSLPLSQQGSSASYHPQLKGGILSVLPTSTNGTNMEHTLGKSFLNVLLGAMLEERCP